jgi:hypothetical protein
MAMQRLTRTHPKKQIGDSGTPRAAVSTTGVVAFNAPGFQTRVQSMKAIPQIVTAVKTPKGATSSQTLMFFVLLILVGVWLERG